ncbi:MAG TPA: hypothetical protein VKG92_06485, partial [Flavobacteriales bacterium]|nr:hypothetical protein [Flavobacteriales bacterium]
MRQEIENAWEDRALLKDRRTVEAIEHVIELLDQGELRVADPPTDGGSAWVVNDWVKKAVILYFPTRGMETLEAGPLEFHDKMRLKRGYAKLKVRVVPHAVARYGAYLAPGTILMPSYVNI